MATKGLVPWRWGREEVPVRRTDELFPAFRAFDRLFDEVFHGFGLAPFSNWPEAGYTPRLDLVENDKEIVVSAELPGLDEKDVEVSVHRDVLTIKGEKRQEKEEKEKNYYRAERSYGAFARQIPLPAEVDTDKISAAFKKGVLTVTLPKIEEAQQTIKKIAIKSEE